MLKDYFHSPLDILGYLIIILLLASILYFFFLKKILYKTYKVNELTGPLFVVVKAGIKRLAISFLLYFLGLALAIPYEATLGLFVAAIGISLSIYYTQVLEGAKIQILIEKKLGNKLSKVTVTNVENLIAKEVSKKLLESIELKEFKNEIENKIIEELKEK